MPSEMAIPAKQPAFNRVPAISLGVALRRLLVTLTILIGAVLMIKMIGAKFTLWRDPGQLILVSSRPLVTDVAFVTAAERHPDLKYLRADEPFAVTLGRTSRDIASPLRLYRFSQHIFKNEAVPALAADGYLGRARTLDLAGFFPLIAMAGVVGSALGFMLPVSHRLTPPLLASMACIAWVKVTGQCATCSTSSLFGYDVAKLGVVF